VDESTRERLEQRSDGFDIARLAASLRSILNLSYIAHLISCGTPSLHTFSSLSFTPQLERRRPSCDVACWHSESYWVDSHRARAWSSATWSRALRRCIRSCKHQVIPYSSAAKRYSRCSVASAGLPFPTLLRRQLFPRPAAGIEYSASKRDRKSLDLFFLFFSRPFNHLFSFKVRLASGLLQLAMDEEAIRPRQ
jgi:hypothetical protein